MNGLAAILCATAAIAILLEIFCGGVTRLLNEIANPPLRLREIFENWFGLWREEREERT